MEEHTEEEKRDFLTGMLFATIIVIIMLLAVIFLKC